MASRLSLHYAVVLQSVSTVWLFATPWTAAHQASLPSTISQSLLKFTFIESVMLSNHLILCSSLLLIPSIFKIMYKCESWTIKKVEYWRIDALKLWFWRRLLRVPWTARRSNELFLKEINPEYSLERLMLQLNFRYFGHLMWRVVSLEKTLMLGRIKNKRSGQQRMRWLDVITNSMDMSLSKLLEIVKTGKPGMLQSSGVSKSQIWLSEWKTTTSMSVV